MTIRARRDDGRLALEVADDGRGIADGFREGTGLRTTRARLAGLYGDAHELRVATRPTGGAVIEVRLPVRLAPANHPGSGVS